MTMARQKGIVNWFKSVAKVWRREFYLVLKDPGVLLFFFALPTLYPIVYTLIYNPEVVKDQPIAVVDNCRSSMSRDLARMIDATEAAKIYGYANSLDEARGMMNRKEVYGILLIPEDYDKKIGRGEAPTVTFYSDMSLLLRYRTFVSGITDVQLALLDQLRSESSNRLGMVSEALPSINIRQESVMMGDPTQGFASFIMPAILVLIIQQSLILGVAMLCAGSSERRRRNGGIDPLAVPAPPGAVLVGKTLCYVLIYLPMMIYTLHFVPVMFSLPHLGNVFHYMLFLLPMLVAASMLGICISAFVTERESSLLVVVFTSVIFLFLSGITWPRYAMNGFWRLLGDCVPATWGMEGFVRLNSNGAALSEESHCMAMMWLLAAVYGVFAYLLTRYRDRYGRLRAGQLI